MKKMHDLKELTGNKIICVCGKEFLGFTAKELFLDHLQEVGEGELAIDYFERIQFVDPKYHKLDCQLD